MREHSSATIEKRPPVLPHQGNGIWWGLLGVVAFSFTVPFTRVAVASLSPLFIGSGRAVIAGILAGAALVLTRQRLPSAAILARLALVAGGVVIGFPFLTSFALTDVPASHGAVVIALLPAATATAAILRTGERPPTTFWLVIALGSLAAVGFAFLQSGGAGQWRWADLLLLGAVVSAAIGYAEGGLLAREIGSWQTIAWALILALPLMLLLAGLAVAAQPPVATPVQWAAFGYLAVVSMFLGFLAWYRGLAIGPIARVSQIQLIQPVLSICWAALLLGEALPWTTWVGGLAVVACAGAAVRVRLGSPSPNSSPSPKSSPTPTR
ncbi:DMT family transporter [Arthrobacter sp. G.S.26]|uniref:DMT family transporter n=1 Tax=Arthrobacter sp. G.S.26 TaxID=3433706 RepID=UPI003D77DA69